MHIQDQITAELIATGWKREGADFRFSKMRETGGAFGLSQATLIMDETGRWLESIDGWNHVIRDVDLRNFANAPKAAIAAALA